VYYLVVAVFLPTSETAIFSKAFDRVRNDPQVCTFDGISLIADETINRRAHESVWRELAFQMGTKSTNCVVSALDCINNSSLHRLDPQNVDHLFMRFYVEGEHGKATVRLEMTKVHTSK
jgi:hypothetical protein